MYAPFSSFTIHCITFPKALTFLLMEDAEYRFHRRSIRLPGYDYAQDGAYFVTICTQERLCVFGQIDNGQILMHDPGRIAYDCLRAIPGHFPSVVLDEFVVMPNHVHFVVVLGRRGEACLALNSTTNSNTGGDDIRATHASPLQTNVESPGPRSGSIGAIVGSYKSAVTKQINELRGTLGARLWQRNYYERIIRSDAELNRIREYVVQNPATWDTDELNPNRT